ncbi:MAG: ABC transporter ATP-binding protein/permease [Oscillospiraceae bacterium]|nr:ABC transporter ATP-binding protein/permease [Oscillospiraceae bacterium]
MIFENTLTNLPIPKEFKEKAEKLIPPGEKVLFALLGDLNLHGHYGASMIAVTRGSVYAFDEFHKGGALNLSIGYIEEAKVKRMYGNAVIRLKLESGEQLNLIRFTYSVSALADAAAAFFENVAGGGEPEKELEMVAGAYEKMRLVCPKCGRKLSRAGSACINCTSKGKLAKKLGAYIMPEKKTLFFCIALSLITTAMALVPPYATKMLVDDIIPNKNIKMLLTVIIALAAAHGIQHSVGAVRGHHLRIIGDRTVARLRNDIYAKAQYLPMSFYDKVSTGSVISRVSGDTNNLQAFMLRVSQDAVVQFFQMVGIIVIMVAMEWRLTLLSLIPVPIVVAVARFFGKRISPIYRRIWRRWASVSSILSDTLPGVRVIKSFTSEQRAIKKFEDYNAEWLKEDVKASKIANIFPHTVTFFVTCGSLLIWGVGGSWAIGEINGITVGLLVAFLSYASKFYEPVNFFANLNDSYQSALTSAERILDIIDAEPEQNKEDAIEVGRLKGKIEFKNVNFSFDKTKKTLTDINITIEPGEIIGIVGTTGSGKSTLINLLMRYYDNYEGDISVDDINIKDIDLQSFREKIGYVQQEPMMFRDTIFRNIAYSNPKASVEEVIHAADVANAHAFIAKIPDAYDTMLGERGVGLSGGERQRLSIARAVLKNPSMLIFDEATAAVDSETEHLIQEAIERLISGRTTLMIAHRLSTLRKANRILVVDKGEVIEFGSHDELMALKGKYHKLIEIQSMSLTIDNSQ